MIPLHGVCILLLAALFSLAGCSLAPHYSRPAAPVPADWPQGSVHGVDAAASSDRMVAQIPWQEYFRDEKLRRLIALALESNRDLRVAALNVERSRAQYQIRRADLLPGLNASGDGMFKRQPEGFSSNGSAETVHQYAVALGVSSYELDLFGRVQSLKDQALQQYFASEQARRSVQISLVAEVAAQYLALAAERERLRLAQETFANEQASLQLLLHRFAAGVSSALDVNQARTSVESARVASVRAVTSVAQAHNALALVVGTVLPGDLLPEGLSSDLDLIPDPQPGLPSHVLLDRPDILQAEHLLQGANANIGAARAAFFPRITLVSSLGVGSDQLSGLFTPGSFAWSFAPRITLPIFQGGANRAGLEVARVDRDMALARYEQVIQTAFREVADALARRSTIHEQVTAQQSLADAAAESHRLSRLRYEKGIDSYLQVLDAQRSLYSAHQGLIEVRLERQNNLVTLFRVLGGGVR